MPSEKLFCKIISNGLDRAASHLFKMIGLALSTPIALLSFRFWFRASNVNIAFPSSLQLVQVLLAKWNQNVSVVILLFASCLLLMYEYSIFGSGFEFFARLLSNPITSLLMSVFSSSLTALYCFYNSVLSPVLLRETDLCLNQRWCSSLIRFF